jgi:hypothetical protein
MGKDVFAGNGLQQMLKAVPEASRAGILTDKALRDIMAASQTQGGSVSRLKSAISRPFTQAGRAEIGAGIKETFTDVPGKIGTKLSNTGRKQLQGLAGHKPSAALWV